MARPPVPPAQPRWVDWRGEQIDPFGPPEQRPSKGPQGPDIDPSALLLRPPTRPRSVFTPSDAECERVFEALVLAGGGRPKTWLTHFLNHLGHRTDRDTRWQIDEVQHALRRLGDAERAVVLGGQGYGVPAPLRTAELPRALTGERGRQAWKAYIRAGLPYTVEDSRLAQPNRQPNEDPSDFVRLALAGDWKRTDWELARPYTLDWIALPEALATAVAEPFVAEVWERMNPTVRDDVLALLRQTWSLQAKAWQRLIGWFATLDDERLARLPVLARTLMAEDAMHRADGPLLERALRNLGGPSVDQIRAGACARQGRWSEAVERFNDALKVMRHQTGARRGLVPRALLHWHLLSLMAAPDAASWAAARKLALTDAGTKDPDPHDGGLGLWAHALALRLGDAAPVAGVFDAPRAWLGTPEHSADRLILAAWVGEGSKGWTPLALTEVAGVMIERGLPWRASLLMQAAERIQLPLPAGAADVIALWPVRYFGSTQDLWRDALAAMRALGDGAAAPVAGAAAPALEWWLSVDDQHRPIDLVPMERPVGQRGPGKPKAVPLSRLKKSQRLDPQDAAVARAITAAPWRTNDLHIDVATAVPALVRHPGLRLAEAPDQPVELFESLPRLEVRRETTAGGDEAYVFHVEPALAGLDSAPDGASRVESHLQTLYLRERSPAAPPLLVVPDGPDRARLLRITAAQRRVAGLVAKRWAVPLQAHAELDAALRALAGHFELHSDAAAGQDVPSDARLRAQLTPLREGLQLRLRVQPFGTHGPVLTAAQGRARLLTRRDGQSLGTTRDLAAEQARRQTLLDALPFLDPSPIEDDTWVIDDPEQALALVERLGGHADIVELQWPKGQALRVLPLAATSVRVAVGSGIDWFSVTGEVQVDEGRVIALAELMTLLRDSRSGRFVALGNGEYLALTEQLHRQLADLQAAGEPGTGRKLGLRLPATAAPWLAEVIDGLVVQADRGWRERAARLDEAAALQPALPATLKASLRPYQLDGFVWMARLAHAGLGACLADDMGLGKTVQTLALLLHRAALGPALVIAPTSVCGNWAAEAARFAPSLSVQIYGEGDREVILLAPGPGDLVVASYSLVQRQAEAFAAPAWASLVLDEAQALKNADTLRAKAVAAIPAGFRLALSGTPVENRLADLWSIMNILNPGLLGSRSRFTERFAGPIERSEEPDARQATQARLRRLVAPFLLRRTKAQVLSDLPPLTELVVRIEPEPDERAWIEAMRRAALERVGALDADDTQTAFRVLAELTRLRRAACDPRLVAPEFGRIGAKASALLELVRGLIDNRHRALVFSQFTDFLAILAEQLKTAGIAYQYLDGGTPGAQRTQRVAAFQAGVGDLFLISLKAGGFGLNLTAADYVIITDPWWNPAAEDQALGRSHRMGQQRPVTVYRLVTAGSIEERIIELHGRKRQLADGILANQDDAQVLDAQALRALFEQ
jgi:superfamily II DNA or RNA helicase